MRRSTRLWPGRVRAAYSETFGESAVVEEGYGPVSVDVPAQSWEEALEVARDGLDCTFFDFLSAVDEWQPPPSNDTAADGPEAGVRIVCHLAHHWTTHRNSGVDHVVIRTLLSHETPTVGSVAHLFACLLYTSPSPRDRTRSRMPSSA